MGGRGGKEVLLTIAYTERLRSFVLGLQVYQRVEVYEGVRKSDTL